MPLDLVKDGLPDGVEQIGLVDLTALKTGDVVFIYNKIYTVQFLRETNTWRQQIYGFKCYDSETGKFLEKGTILKGFFENGVLIKVPSGFLKELLS